MFRVCKITGKSIPELETMFPKQIIKQSVDNTLTYKAKEFLFQKLVELLSQTFNKSY